MFFPLEDTPVAPSNFAHSAICTSPFPLLIGKMHRGPCVHKIDEYYLRLNNKATTRFREKNTLNCYSKQFAVPVRQSNIIYVLSLVYMTKMLILFLGRILSSSWIIKIIPRLSNELWLSQSIQIMLNGKQTPFILKLLKRIAEGRKWTTLFFCSLLLQTHCDSM
jgi:hypothetical protein